MNRPPVYEFPAWRDPPGYAWPVVVDQVLTDLTRQGGSVPTELADDRQVRAFAAACSIPLVDEDIEADLTFPHPRWASRAYVRREFARFVAWLEETGWLDKPKGVDKKNTAPGSAPEMASGATSELAGEPAETVLA